MTFWKTVLANLVAGVIVTALVWAIIGIAAAAVPAVPGKVKY